MVQLNQELTLVFFLWVFFFKSCTWMRKHMHFVPDYATNCDSQKVLKTFYPTWILIFILYTWVLIYSCESSVSAYQVLPKDCIQNMPCAEFRFGPNINYIDANLVSENVKDMNHIQQRKQIFYPKNKWLRLNFK